MLRAATSFTHRCLLAVAGVVIFVSNASTQSIDHPRIQTNESYIKDALSPARLPLDNPRATFAAIFNALGDEVQVFPTENYYYFSFFQDGVRYEGNIRLAANDRDSGKLHFAYFESFAGWRKQPRVTHVVLDKSDGVTLERIAPLKYRVSFRGKVVLFELNDLKSIRPPAYSIAADERFLGPIFDESAIRFFLVFNRRLKLFHYILDETIKPTDELVPNRKTDRILIGKRTGFAYYRDHFLERKILIGVFDANVRANNYLDGPFDQLPDNFIEGEELRQSIIEANPSIGGKIDRFGYYLGDNARYLIAPYLRYHNDGDLFKIHDCATRNITKPNYYRCFDARNSSARSFLDNR